MLQRELQHVKMRRESCVFIISIQAAPALNRAKLHVLLPPDGLREQIMQQLFSAVLLAAALVPSIVRACLTQLLLCTHVDWVPDMRAESRISAGQSQHGKITEYPPDARP